MTIEQRDTTIQTARDVPPAALPAMPAASVSAGAIARQETFSRHSTVVRASRAELTRRVVVFTFGLIQAVIVLRIVLLMLNARPGNDLVAGILNVSQVFVGPFEGVLHSNGLSAGGSTLDLAAVVALVGWTLVELLVVAAINLFRRESALEGAPLG